MKKSFLLFFLVLLFLGNFTSAVINNYNVPETIELDKILAISGEISPVANNVKCSIQLFNSDGNFVYRLTDEFSTSAGLFASSYFVIKEPLLKRGSTYSVLTTCANDTASSNFTIKQRETIGHTAEYETKFIFERGNLDSFLFFGGLFFVIIIIFSVFIFWWNRAKGLWG